MTTNHHLPTPIAPDAVDRVLGDYFHAQLPKQWRPSPQPWQASIQPASLAQNAIKGDSLAKSRLTLVASVALLLGACWYLSGRMTNGKKTNSINFEGGEANTKALKDLAKPKPKTP